MSNPAALSGDYVDLKFIKTRNVAQVVIEIPIEAADQFVADFGTPNAAKSVPVAIARLVKDRIAIAPPVNKERQKFRDLPASQQAAMRCNEQAFWKYLTETVNPNNSVLTSDDAADTVRDWCGVKSRAEITAIPEAAMAWSRMNDAYELWMRGIQ